MESDQTAKGLGRPGELEGVFRHVLEADLRDGDEVGSFGGGSAGRGSGDSDLGLPEHRALTNNARGWVIQELVIEDDAVADYRSSSQAASFRSAQLPSR